MVRIRRLDVRGFRGVRQERSLLFEGKSIVLFGENGSGKSSFVDALEKLFAGRISTLDGSLGLSSDRHGPHIRDDSDGARIQVTFTDSAGTTFANGTALGNLPAEVAQYVQAAGENLYILRRRQVLEFINSAPRERYGLLRPFLPLSRVEEMESALRAARDQAQTVVHGAKARFDQVVAQLRRELRLSDSSEAPADKEIVGSVARELVEAGQRGISSTNDFGSAIRDLDEAVAAFGDLRRQAALDGVIRVLGELQASIPREQLDSLSAGVEALRSKEAEEARVFYEAVLEQGIRWIEEERRDTCPLCENRIVAENTIVRARERLTVMRDVLELRRRTRTLQGQVEQALRAVLDGVERATRRLSDLSDDDGGGCRELLGRLGTAASETVSVITAEIRDLSADAVSRASHALTPDASLMRSIAAEEKRFQVLLQSLPLPEAANRLVSLRDKVGRIQQAWVELGAAGSRLQRAQTEVQLASRLHELAQIARKEEVQRILDELSQDVDSLYTALHPGESHGGIRVEVRHVGQGSANLKAAFYERRDEDPRAYYSDAHLDTLGLSVFLALRRWYRRQRPSFNLLVLDDVLTSIDVQHAVRLSELLLREFRDYQILLTTHDRIWFEHLRDIQARCRVPENFVNKIIHKWSIDDGPDIREPEDERAEIDRQVADGSGPEIASTAGRLLEHILQEMRYSVRLSVQAKRGEQYEIGDLWPSFFSAVRKNYPSLFAAGLVHLEALDVRWPVRNWIGAHRNQWAENVPRPTAIEFAESVRGLFDLLFCLSCRRFVSPSATPLGQLACRCGERVYAAPGREAVRPRTKGDLVRETKGAFRDAKLDTVAYLASKHTEIGREE